MRLTHGRREVFVLCRDGLLFEYLLLKLDLFCDEMVLVTDDLFQIFLIAFYDCLEMNCLEMTNQKYSVKVFKLIFIDS